MFAANASAQTYVSSHAAGDIYFSHETGHHSIVANKNYEADTIITFFGASEILRKPNRYTVQKSANEHIVLDPLYLQYLNHSCDPNCFLDLQQGKLIAIKPIMQGEPLTFFYPSTEWEMEEPFQCLCGSVKCLGMIQGASRININTLKSYRLSPFIESMLSSINTSH
jgi:hypothetical protein